MQQRRAPGPAGAGSPTRPGAGRVPGGGSGAPRAQRAPGSRPSTARRTAAAGSAKRTRAPQPRRATGRAVVLSMVLFGLLLAYTYPVRAYLAQQAEIAALEGKQAVQREKIGALRERSAKWDDPQYVISQARKRLNMGLPGEQSYVVVDPDKAAVAARAAAGQQSGDQQPRPWYGKLWWSVEAADRR